MIKSLENTEKILKNVLGYEVRLNTSHYGVTGIFICAGEVDNSLASNPDEVLKIIKQCSNDILNDPDTVSKMGEQIADLKDEIKSLEKYKTHFDLEKELRGVK